MPLYEYECGACGQRFELIRRFSDPPVEVCAVCGKGPVQRLLSSPAIQFKGSGWYITDYAQKGKGAKGEKSTGDAASTTKTDGSSSATGSDKPASPTSSNSSTPGSKKD